MGQCKGQKGHSQHIKKDRGRIHGPQISTHHDLDQQCISRTNVCFDKYPKAVDRSHFSPKGQLTTWQKTEEVNFVVASGLRKQGEIAIWEASEELT